MNFKSDIVIGLEVHCELNTATKLFCSCPRIGNEIPNSRCCPVCLGHPGSKPVLNKKAIEAALKLGLATGCKIAKQLIFSRKSYFYPDLAKNYQITQYEAPLCQNGSILLSDGKRINLTRIHLEEDPAALIHPSKISDSSYVLIDYNRSGNPLVELVTEPELESPEDARSFLKKLRTILLYLKIFDPDSCIIKADANISIQDTGYKKVEIKNITGFKDIEDALFYEVERQKKNMHDVITETRGFDASARKTFSLRRKETIDDYGYITEPDITPIPIHDDLILSIQKKLPELAEQKIEKFIKKYGIKKEDAEVLAAEKELAELFERVAKKIDPELAAKWIRRELTRVLNYHNKRLEEIEVDEENLISLLHLIMDKKITEKTGQKIIEKFMEAPFNVIDYIKKENLSIVSDIEEIKKFCKEAIEELPQAVNDYKEGKKEALNFVVGSVMKKTKGRGSPQEIIGILKKLL